MKPKHWLSLAGSLFLAWESKAQQTTVKKETTPQVKANLPTSTVQKDGKIKPEKEMKMSKHRPENAVPITVKPGETIFSTRFEKDAEGDMPAGWRTNGNGAITKIMGLDGAWLKLDETTRYELNRPLTLPENFDLEFDFLANYKDDQAVPELSVRLFRKGKEYAEPGLILLLSPNGGTANEGTRIQVVAQDKNGAESFRSTARTLRTFQDKNGKNQPVRFLLSVKGDRLKAFVDNEKVYDLTELMPAETKFDRLEFSTASYGGPKSNYQYYLSNIQLKAGE